MTPRKIDNGNAIKFKNEYYQVYENGMLKCFRARTECLVIKAFDGELYVTVDDKIYELCKLRSHQQYSKEFDFIHEVQKEEKKYIPRMSQSWKLGSLKKQIEMAHKYKTYA